MTFKSMLFGGVTALTLSFAIAQEQINQQDLLLDVLLAAYNGGAQTYAEKTNTKVQLLSREELSELETQLAQVQELVTDEDGQIDIDKVNALLNLASKSDYEIMGIKASSLQEPLQMLKYISSQGRNWQQALLELKERSQPVIESTLNELTQTSDKQGAQSIANVLSILVGAGMAIEEIAQDQQPNTIQSKALSNEVDYLKALAEKDMPALLHTSIHHQFEALISRLKIAYANTSVGEQTQADTQNNILAVKYFLSQVDGQLTQTEYETLLLWLNRLGGPYKEIRQQVERQQADLTKNTK